MAYYNTLQNGYQPTGSPGAAPSIPPTGGSAMQPAIATSNIYWVQGMEGAKAYPIAPGTNIALWDSEAQSIYIKMADASGVPQPLRILDYTERVQTPEVAEKPDYVTADDVEAIMDSKINALTAQIEMMLKNQSKPYHKKGGNNG